MFIEQIIQGYEMTKYYVSYKTDGLTPEMN